MPTDAQKHNGGECGQRCLYCAQDELTEQELSERIDRSEAAFDAWTEQQIDEYRERVQRY
jgi:hypothetical protein